LKKALIPVVVLLITASIITGCSSGKSSGTPPVSSPATSAPVTSAVPATPTITPSISTPAASVPVASIPKASSTTPAAFPYQGSGTGTWSGQLVVNNTPYSVSGSMSVAVDASGVFSGSISSSSGGTVPTTITAQVDSNGNLNGSVSFTVSGTTFVTTWQGKMTASGNSLSMQGTWTSKYGSGTFSGTGTRSGT
jgi:hypothetical protein